MGFSRWQQVQIEIQIQAFAKEMAHSWWQQIQIKIEYFAKEMALSWWQQIQIQT